MTKILRKRKATRTVEITREPKQKECGKMQKTKQWLCLLLAVVTVFSTTTCTAAAAGDEDLYTVTVSGTWDYDEIQEEIELINAERAKVGAEPLALDAELTEAAMQRALEIGFYFSHTRPDSSSCFGINSRIFGENIAAGGGYDAQDVITAWMNSPGHRSNMLSTAYKSVGLGFFKIGVVTYAVQCFSRTACETPCTQTGAVSGGGKVVAQKDLIEVSAIFGLGGSCMVGTQADIDCGYANQGAEMFRAISVPEDFVFSSSDPSVVTVDSRGHIEAVSEGKATITVALKEDESIYYSEEISAYRLNIEEGYSASGLESTYVYTGEPITPTVKLSTWYRTLEQGKDYTVEYRNNTLPGTATVEITGIGGYKGVQTLYFQIVKKEGHTGHQYVAMADRAPTCTDAGSTGGEVCTVCGTFRTQPTITQPLGHDFTEWEIIRETTCARAGERVRHCDRCGLDDFETIEALPHTFGEREVAVEATCVRYGTEIATCQVCGVRYAYTIQPLGHDFGAWEDQTPATCTETGTQVRFCSRCDAQETREVEALGHDFTAWTVTRNATCTEAGSETRRCQTCGAAETRTIKPKGHTPGEWVVTKAPTETQVGERTQFCAVCGEVLAVEAFGVGDVNQDGKVDAVDARWVLQAAAGMRPLEDTVAADVNQDGEIDAVDARWILQAAAGMRTL